MFRIYINCFIGTADDTTDVPVPKSPTVCVQKADVSTRIVIITTFAISELFPNALHLL